MFSRRSTTAGSTARRRPRRSAPRQGGGTRGRVQREDGVERPHAEKMKGKSKNDYMGRAEQMSEYIKRLRACIRWYVDLEDGYLAELEKLQGQIDAENTRHTEFGNALSDAPSAPLCILGLIP
ncbi:hypothetical protein QYE76_031878 [Lolium multiflorum]|uniref:Uncharacterized protein n=1 Tax=Lolium multiflorum TaxID=4521 RepID=A0AAD8QSG3_LOLMU|nr:hypothetical protein QYE76_031878 [Lolium multiflorum]